MGNSIKIGITGLPRAGKTQVLEKVVAMIEKKVHDDPKQKGRLNVVGGMVSYPILENGQRMGFKVMNWQSKEGVMAEDYESRVAVFEMGVDIPTLEAVGVTAIREAVEEFDIIVIDEVGKIELESEAFVAAVREALECDKPILLTLHKKSRHALLQDIRRRDDARILEVTPVNRNLLPYKILNLLKETGL